MTGSKKDEKLIQRAVRFGVPVGGSSELLASAPLSNAADEEKKKMRSERFGVAGSGGNEVAKKNQRLERFGRNVVSVSTGRVITNSGPNKRLKE